MTYLLFSMRGLSPMIKNMAFSRSSSLHRNPSLSPFSCLKAPADRVPVLTLDELVDVTI
jgi:hypothetical protein